MLDRSLERRLDRSLALDGSERLHGVTASGPPFTMYDPGAGGICWSITRGIGATGCEHPIYLLASELPTTPRFAMERAEGEFHFVYTWLPEAAAVRADAQPTLVEYLDSDGRVIESHTEVRNPYEP